MYLFIYLFRIFFYFASLIIYYHLLYLFLIFIYVFFICCHFVHVHEFCRMFRNVSGCLILGVSNGLCEHCVFFLQARAVITFLLQAARTLEKNIR